MLRYAMDSMGEFRSIQRDKGTKKKEFNQVVVIDERAAQTKVTLFGRLFLLCAQQTKGENFYSETFNLNPLQLSAEPKAR